MKTVTVPVNAFFRLLGWPDGGISKEPIKRTVIEPFFVEYNTP